MSDPARIIETLKSKAMLLIQREREVYALRLARERMMAWLRGFQAFSAQPSPADDAAILAGWTATMVRDLHFQTAAVYEQAGGTLSLLEGMSHTDLPPKVDLDEAGRRLLRERREGFYDGGAEAEAASLSHALGMRRVLWYVAHVLSGARDREVVLVAGVADGVGGAYGETASDDFINFTMLGRHVAVLLRNEALISDLRAARGELQELFDHMRQAIVAFDRDGVIGGVSSRRAKLLFGGDIEGRSVRDLLHPGAPPWDIDARALTEWIDMAFAADPAGWASCEVHAPREAIVATPRGEPSPFALEFRPLVRDGVVAQLMLLATDVGRERELETALRVHEAEEAKRAAAMRRLIAGGTQVFVAFLESAIDRVGRCVQALEGVSGALPIDRIDDLFRHVHTMRGEARAFDLADLDRALGDVERDLNALRGAVHHGDQGVGLAPMGRLVTGLASVSAALAQAREQLAAASPLGALVFDQVTVSRSALRELLDLGAGRHDRLGLLIARLAGVPLGVAAAGVLESAPAWAMLAENEVTVQVEPRERIVPQPLGGALSGVLAHLVRNAIAHGVEAPEQRRAAGKAPQGIVRIRADEDERGVRVTVEDDGRGLDVEGLRRAADGATDDGDPTELAFRPGVSTRRHADALGGWGVGLDAVREELRRVGYRVLVAFEPGRWTRFTIEPGASAVGRERR